MRELKTLHTQLLSSITAAADMVSSSKALGELFGADLSATLVYGAPGCNGGSQLACTAETKGCGRVCIGQLDAIFDGLEVVLVDDLRQADLPRFKASHRKAKCLLSVPIVNAKTPARSPRASSMPGSERAASVDQSGTTGLGRVFLTRDNGVAFDEDDRTLAMQFAAVWGRILTLETSLKESQARYERVTEQAAESIFLMDRNLNFVGVNSVGCVLLDLERQVVLERNLRDVVVDAWDPRVDPHLDATGDILRTQRVVRRHDGVLIPIDASVSALDNGLFLAIVRDVTERKLAEAQLAIHVQILDAIRDVQARYIELGSSHVPFRAIVSHLQAITNSESVHIYEVITNSLGSSSSLGAIIERYSPARGTPKPPPWLNDAILEGLRERFALDYDWSALFHPLEVVGVEGEHWVVPLDSGSRMVGFAFLENPKHLNEEVVYSLRPFLTMCANLVSASQTTHAHEIAEVKAAHLGKILDHASNEILVFRGDSMRLVGANEGAHRGLGATLQDIQDQSIREIFEFDDVVFEDALERLRAGVQTVAIESTVHRLDGSTFPAETSLQIAHLDDEEYFVIIVRDISIRRQALQHVQHALHHDRLTGLPNRHGLLRALESSVDGGTTRPYLGLMFIDIHRFKPINEALGHEVGDQLIAGIAERLSTRLSPDQFLARLGGDEFTVVVPDLGPGPDIIRIAHQLLLAFDEPFSFDRREIFLSANVGISLLGVDAKDITGLLRNAGMALAHAKRTGPHSVQIFNVDMNTAVDERLVLHSELRRAVERQELLLHYQPQVNLQTGRIVGVEALVRWHHPRLGLVAPDSFIPIAEETGLIIALGDWVLNAACVQTKKWHDSGFGGLTVAVNVSARQVVTEVMPTLLETIHKSGIDPACIEFELTESLLMEEQKNINSLLPLQQKGVRLSIDDFGIGYSSLNYLKRMNVDSLKIDRSFVRDLVDDPDDAAIVRAIIAMAHSLGIQVIAEGVETVEQLAFLRAEKCDAFQGFYFSPPLPAEGITLMLHEGRHLGDL